MISLFEIGITAKELAEKEKADAENEAAEAKAVAAAEIKRANALKSEAASETKKAKDLYHQQANLNGLYRQAVSDRDGFKTKADKADELTVELGAAYKSIGAMAKAVGSLLFAPRLENRQSNACTGAGFTGDSELRRRLG